ncbi:methyltransferase domain-containing protein [Nostoc sp. FACHB-152]|uniref:class I SAM-dependent methyltransferase n=1 Tax=unclassified Nostoc TaxID=2593658 RepID=UPI0016842F4F|nr:MULTISPECIES: methyltransferase domain-containing protein [unclassified Nostoc]MBD2445913.1 methyltransferase domain-containing protein [Nostoc sp. FACHB-152]MBD2467911.1 methyltransferase domain-containing protein [Nostoc sp. FACHB-145]
MSETLVSQEYNRIANFYDQRWNSYISKTLSFLKNWVNIPSTAIVLDVACGTGEFERLLLQKNSTQQVTGIDISEKMLSIAQEKCLSYPNVSFKIGSASALPCATNTFDIIVSASAFHYFEDPDTALAEMKRVLKPDGQLVILDWCRDYFLCKLLDLFLRVFDSAHKQCYSQAELHQILTNAGFNICRATKTRFGFFWGLMIATVTPEI